MGKAVTAARQPDATQPGAGLPPGTCAADLTSYLRRKPAALERHKAEFWCRPEIASHTRRSRCTPPSATTWPRPA